MSIRTKFIQRKRDGKWYIEFYATGRGQKRKALGGDKREAANLYGRIETAVSLGDLDPYDSGSLDQFISDVQPSVPDERPDGASVSIDEAIRQYDEHTVNLKPKTRDVYASILKLFRGSLPKSAVISDVSPGRLNKFLSDYTPQTRASYARTLKAFVRWCIAKKWIPKETFETYRFPTAGKIHKRPLTRSEYFNLLETMQEAGDTWLYWIVKANCEMGLRRAEVVRLKWRDVNLEDRTVLVSNEGASTTKSGNERIVPIRDVPYEVLTEINNQAGRVSLDTHVFRRNGRPITGDYLYKRFKQYVTDLGLDERINFHSTRHTAATWLITWNVHLRLVQAMMGHASITTTEEYGSLDPKFYTQAVVSAGKDSKQESVGTSDELRKLQEQNAELMRLLQQLIQKDTSGETIRPGSLVDQIMKKAKRE